MPETTPSTAQPHPPISRSLHGDFIEQSIPDWLINATPERLAAFKDAPAEPPPWYRQATLAQRQALHTQTLASFTAQTRLDQAMAGLQSVDAFARPLLVKALKDQFSVELDVDSTFLQLRKAVELGILGIDIASYDVLKLPLLQAALHNFEASECEADTFHESSGFIEQDAADGTFKAVTTPLTVTQFTRLCRRLDIGSQYQAYLKDYLYPKDGVADYVLRDKFIAAQKAALRVAAEIALLKQDIEPRDYRMILSVTGGERLPNVNGKPVWFRDLGLMKHRMTGCVLFVISDKYKYTDEWLLYIPNDPQAPLKRYSGDAMKHAFKQRFTERDAKAPNDGSPTPYQRFFSRFVGYADLPDYFSQLTQATPDPSFAHKAASYAPVFNEIAKGFNPFAVFTGIRDLPPQAPGAREANPDPFLAPVDLPRAGHGLWADNIDLWTYLYDQHRAKAIADARAHAVPTADVDARARSQKFASLLNIGMLLFTGVSMFVPGLGELMLTVMAGQLLYESFEGVLEWSEGDRQAAKAHLLDVAQNLALLAVTAGAGKGLAKLVAAKATPVIENLEPVTLPDGQTRLWKPDLSGYEQTVSLPDHANAQGQYRVDGKTFIRIDGKAYEQAWDPAQRRWRIRHPSDASAYQPLLSHNGAGAWRHTLERPLSWDRLTLLRRMGPITEGASDETLLKAADLSGIDDNALRKMHLDNALPPPALSDALRLLEADRDVAQVLEQLGGARPINGRYFYSLPLVTQMPRWPLGRMLEVFEGPQLSGPSVKYGSEHRVPVRLRKAPIRVSRAEVLGGELPQRILAQLDESEVTHLLGGEAARVVSARPREFSKQLVDFARTRTSAIFDSLYNGTEPRSPWVARLQRECPGLSDTAAKTVLAQADGAEITRMQASNKVPLRLLEQGRWYAQQGQLTRALSGLHSEHMASADSRHLALHTLAKLPGWPQGLRLEVREGNVAGALLDAIGDEGAASRKYLVKRGPGYQAFDERGEALNSVTAQGDNFFASVMHALPDSARGALGVPEVNQHAALQRTISEFAVNHAQDSARIVSGRMREQPWFRPPQRIAANLLGYPASGRGVGEAPDLTARVRAVYPQLTNDQADGFILKQMIANKTDREIVQLLNERQREWQALEATLDQWVAAEPDTLFSRSIWGRSYVAEDIKHSWQNAPLAELPGFATLELRCNDVLPALTADFSHVRDLTIAGPNVTDANLESLLRTFPGVQRLELKAVSASFKRVPDALGTLSKLTDLSISTGDAAAPLADSEVAKLERLTQLKSLSLYRILGSLREFDVSALTQLRRLKISKGFLGTLPKGVLGLPHLERLDLKDMVIRRLPDELLKPGHERVWRGLSLNWSLVERDSLRAAFEFVRAQPEHLVDEEEMIREYCHAELDRISAQSSPSVSLAVEFDRQSAFRSAFFNHFTGARARFQAVEALRQEQAALNVSLEAWRRRNPSQVGVVEELRTRWWEGLMPRFGARGSTALELAGLSVADLPILPEDGFTHIRSVNLRGLRAPLAQVREFVRSFGQVRSLDLNDSALTELPFEAADLPMLENLDLGKNPLVALDVSGMHRLKALDLSGSGVRSWPKGAEQLAQLGYLDLRDSAITALPAQVLAQDRMLLVLNVHGLALDAPTLRELTQAMSRVERVRGLPEGTLARFAGEAEETPYFPPLETALSVSRDLLPMAPPALGEGAAWREQSLQRIQPQFSIGQVRAGLAQLRLALQSDAAIDARLIQANQALDTMTQTLNGWLFSHRSSGLGWQISSESRALAAARIIDCWRLGALDGLGLAPYSLDLKGLQVGDLPALAGDFSHVARLDLTGVRLSAQGSNAFLRAFSNVRYLTLDGQHLATLPEAVAEMTQLDRLSLASIELSDPAPLYPTLRQLQHLRVLDLGYNNLHAFSVEQFDHLEELNLSQNLLERWPAGALQAPRLRRLNLSGNEINDIPAQALEGAHDALMAGTDMSDNRYLSAASLQRLRDYGDRRGLDHVLGMTPEELEGDSDDEPELDQPDEVISEDETAAIPEQLAPWLESVPAAEVPGHRARWQRLADEPDNAEFFHLLLRMQDTREFTQFRADLTRRVWRLLEAAEGDTELRQTLFSLSATHDTCIDGRTLAFSNLEVKAFEYQALREIPPGLAQRGRALLNLSRQLFRLGQVERLADASLTRGADAAEVRLSYRIGLTNGWRDGLPLPGQPRYMAFARPVEGEVRANALREVEQAETTEQFYEELISREYWVRYLEEKYPQPLRELQRQSEAEQEKIEEQYPGYSSEAYIQALQSLEVDGALARNQKLLELSRLEERALAVPARPGP